MLLLLLLLLNVMVFLSRLLDQTTSGRFRTISWVMVKVWYCYLRWMMPLLFTTAILSPFWRLLLCWRRLLEYWYNRRCRRQISLPSNLLHWLCMLMQCEIPKHLRYLCIPSYLLWASNAALFLLHLRLLHGNDRALIILKQEGVHLQLRARLLGLIDHVFQRGRLIESVGWGGKVFKRILLHKLI